MNVRVFRVAKPKKVACQVNSKTHCSRKTLLEMLCQATGRASTLILKGWNTSAQVLQNRTEIISFNPGILPATASRKRETRHLGLTQTRDRSLHDARRENSGKLARETLSSPLRASDNVRGRDLGEKEEHEGKA